MADSENERNPKPKDRASGMTSDELKESLDELARNVDDLVDRLTMDMADAPVGTTPASAPKNVPQKPEAPAVRADEPAAAPRAGDRDRQSEEGAPTAARSSRDDELEIDLDAMTDRMIDSVTSDEPAKNDASPKAAPPTGPVSAKPAVAKSALLDGEPATSEPVAAQKKPSRTAAPMKRPSKPVAVEKTASEPAAAEKKPPKTAAAKKKRKTGPRRTETPGVALPKPVAGTAAGGRRGGRTWRWLAAAAVLGVVATGAWLVISPDGSLPRQTLVAETAPAPVDDDGGGSRTGDLTFPASTSLFGDEPSVIASGAERAASEDAVAAGAAGPVTEPAPEVESPAAGPAKPAEAATRPDPNASRKPEPTATQRPQTAPEKPKTTPEKTEAPAPRKPDPAPAGRPEPAPTRRPSPRDTDTKLASTGARGTTPAATDAPTTASTEPAPAPPKTTVPSPPATSVATASTPGPADTPAKPGSDSPTTPTAPAPMGTTGPEPAEDSFRPPEILDREEPVYPSRARKRGEGGVIELKVLVNEQGRVVRVMIVSGIPGSELEARAIDAALRSTYRPATEDGESVEAWTTERFVFEP